MAFGCLGYIDHTLGRALHPGAIGQYKMNLMEREAVIETHRKGHTHREYEAGWVSGGGSGKNWGMGMDMVNKYYINIFINIVINLIHQYTLYKIFKE